MARAVVVVGIAGALGGCSVSYKMGGLFGEDEPKTTSTVQQAPAPAAVEGQPATASSGSVAAPVAFSSGSSASPALASMAPSNSVGLSESDWLYARGALGLALTGSAEGPPVPWANPSSGVRGNFRPLGEEQVADGRSCRSFIAVRVEGGREANSVGRACKGDGGQWDVAESGPAPQGNPS